MAHSSCTWASWLPLTAASQAVIDAPRARFSAVYKPGCQLSVDEVYKPGCQLSVDEAMIPFKGDSSKLYQ